MVLKGIRVLALIAGRTGVWRVQKTTQNDVEQHPTKMSKSNTQKEKINATENLKGLFRITQSKCLIGFKLRTASGKGQPLQTAHDSSTSCAPIPLEASMFQQPDIRSDMSGCAATS